MQRTLITGLSGVGKSTLIVALAARGYRAVDLDSAAYSEWVERTDEPARADDVERVGVWRSRDWVWRVDRVQQLLAGAGDADLFLAGCSPNQGMFYARLDHVILLSVPAPIMAERLRDRTTNAYGKQPHEWARVVQQIATIEPLLRRRACLEVDGSAPPDRVLEAVLTHMQDRAPGQRPCLIPSGEHGDTA